jgi:acetyl esterase
MTMHLPKLDPALLDAQRQVNQMLAQMPSPDVRTPEGLAVLREITHPPQGVIELTPTDVIIAGPGGDLRLHMFIPAGPVRAVMLRIHGGGFAAGAPQDDDTLNDHIARTCHVAIVSPDYRLAPEVSAPEGIEDCVAAARWVASQARERFGTGVLLLAGISAGSQLAAATLLRIRDEDGPAFAGVHLDCGCYDLSGTPSVRAADDTTLILTGNLLSGLFDISLPGIDQEGRRDPKLSPLYADLRGLPPALFTVGELDPLSDDSRFMAARWEAAGNQAELDVWPQGAHAFTNMGTPLAKAALARTTSWIDGVLDNPIAVVRRFIDEVINGGNHALIDELWTPDMTWHGGSMGEFPGLSEWKASMTAGGISAFSGMHLDVKEIITSGDQVVVRFTNSGTHTGPFMGVPATGKHGEWLGIAIYTVRSGKIVEAWFGEDILGMLLQLGAITLPA